MAICVNCGREIKVIARNCPYCNTPIGVASVTSKETLKHIKNNYDHASNGVFLLSVFIPLIGLIIYSIKREEEPLNGRSALSGFLVGTVIYLAMISLILLIIILK